MISKKINYKTDGNGKDIVLIHGLSDNLEYWEPLVQFLKDKYEIIRYDLRGHGKTPLEDEDITIDLYVDDLEKLLDELKIEECVLVGFSLGGLIAQEYAAKFPEKVSSIILMSTFQKCTPHTENILKKLKNDVLSSFTEFFDHILPIVLCPKVIQENVEEINTIREFAKENANTEAISKAIDAILTFDNTLTVNCPTLIMYGKYDDMIPFSSQETMQENIENSELIVLDNVKHNLLVGKNVVSVGVMIDEFITKHE